MAKSEDPKFVRLSNRLTRGMISDTMESGWSISGLDVKPFPDAKRKAAAKFVRKQINAGNLEACSRAEYDDVQEQAASLATNEDSMVQEGNFQKAAAQAAANVEAIRAGAGDSTDDDEEEAEEPDDSETSEDEDSNDDSSDDDGEDEDPAPVKKAAKKSAAKKKS